MNRIKFVVFDLDGTLVDSKYDLTEAVNFTRKCYNMAPLCIEKVASYLGSGITALVKSVLPGIDGETFENAVVIFKKFYSEHLLDKTKPYDKVPEMLTMLDGIKKAVLSNKTEIFSKNIIESLELNQYFDVVYGGDSFMQKKPSPEPIYEIMKKFSVEKENIVMVGDGINDILAGKSAHITTIGILYGYSSKEQVEKLCPDYIAKTPEDAANIIRSL